MPKSIEEVIKDIKLGVKKVPYLTKYPLDDERLSDNLVSIIDQALRSAGCIMKHDIEWPGEEKCLKHKTFDWQCDVCKGHEMRNDTIDLCRKAVEATTSD